MSAARERAGGPAEVGDRLRRFWDEDAATYDRSPGHAVSDPAEAEAWKDVLRRTLPPPPARVLDAGAGTGAMSLLAAELGYRVTALDLSPGMLARAGEKAESRGLDLEVVVGPADEPPAGPFDAVIERHLMWTLPDPTGALAAWREATRGSRAVLLEGLWGRHGAGPRLRKMLAEGVDRFRGDPPDHHGEYEPDLLSALPFSGGLSPGPLLDAAARAGWRRARVERLRDVERAAQRAQGPILGPLRRVSRFAIVLEG